MESDCLQVVPLRTELRLAPRPLGASYPDLGPGGRQRSGNSVSDSGEEISLTETVSSN